MVPPWRDCRLLEMLTTCRGCCGFESACALPLGVIRGCETTSNTTTSPVSPPIGAAYSDESWVSPVMNGVQRTATLPFFIQIRTMVRVLPSMSAMLGSSSANAMSDFSNSK